MSRSRMNGLRTAAAVVLGIAMLSGSPSVAVAEPGAGSPSSSASPDARSSRWVIGFGSIGPVNTSMTVRQAIATLHSGASATPPTPYCGVFGLSGRTASGLTGVESRRGGRLEMLSVGSLFGSSRVGLPKIVETAEGIRIGSSVAALKAAYPHRLKKGTEYFDPAYTLPGGKRPSIGFYVSGKVVTGIATASSGLLGASEFCG